MKYKKWLIITCLIIFLLAIVNVSAYDVNDTNVVSLSDANDTIMTSDYNSIENEDVSSSEHRILGAAHTYATDAYGGSVYVDNDALGECSFMNSAVNTQDDGGIYFNGENRDLLSFNFENNFAENASYCYGENPLEEESKQTTTLSTVDSFTYYNHTSLVYAQLKDENGNLLVGEQVRIFLNNEFYYRTTTDGNGKIIILNQTKFLPNEYRATVYYDGNSKYKASNSSFVLTVNKAVTIFLASNVYVSDPNDAVVTVTLTDFQRNIISGIKVKLTVGNLSKTALTDENGQISLNFSSLGPGEYKITARSAATELYEGASVTFKGYIGDGKTDVTLTVPDVTIRYGETGIAVATLKDENGNILSGIKVKLTVGISSLTTTAETDANGQVFLDFSSLGPGKYTIHAKSENTYTYNSAETFAVAIINSNTTLTFSSTEIKYGTTNNIVVTLKDEIGAPIFGVDVKLIVGNLAIVRVTNLRGEVSLDISSLEPGEYKMTARSAATKAYNKAINNTKLTIISYNTLSIPKVEFKHGDTGAVVATLRDGKGNILEGVKVKLVVGNLTKISRTGDNGQVSLDISSLGPGDYRIGARSAQSDFYKEYKGYSVASIYESRVNPTLTIANIAADYGTGVAVATLKDVEGNPISGVKVKLVVDNLTKIARTDDNGQISLDLSSLKPGVYRIGARSASTCLYNEVKVYAKATISINTTLTIPDTMTHDNSNLVAATLKDANGNLISGVQVKLSFRGINSDIHYDWIGISNWKGQAIVMGGLTPGLYNLAAESVPTDIYHAAKAYAKVTITSPTFLTIPDVNVNQGSGVVVATLNDARGEAVSGVKVKLVVGNLTKTAKTDKYGKVSLDISSLEPGEYQITGQSAATEFYLKTKNHAKAIVS